MKIKETKVPIYYLNDVLNFIDNRIDYVSVLKDIELGIFVFFDEQDRQFTTSLEIQNYLSIFERHISAVRKEKNE